ncbi:MAG: hypothetical protein WC989_03195 [Micavibrio sp.]
MVAGKNTGFFSIGKDGKQISLASGFYQEISGRNPARQTGSDPATGAFPLPTYHQS